MHLYKQEFGEAFELGFELGHFPFLLDKSWHNDVCPSFMFKSKKGSDSSNLDQHKSQQNDQYLVLWTDYFNENPIHMIVRTLVQVAMQSSRVYQRLLQLASVLQHGVWKSDMMKRVSLTVNIKRKKEYKTDSQQIPPESRGQAKVKITSKCLLSGQMPCFKLRFGYMMAET